MQENVGLNTAKGDFIGFVDSDDYISETNVSGTIRGYSKIIIQI